MFPALFKSHSIWSGLGESTFHIDPDNLRVRTEQLRTRLAGYPSLVLGQVVLQFLFVLMFWGYAPHRWLLVWLASFYLLHTLELSKWSMHRNRLETLQECRSWHVWFTAFSLATGLLWGAAAVAFFPQDIGYQSLLICVMLGLVAAAVILNPVHPPALYVYLFGIMVPLIARVSFENDTVHWILVLMLSVFTLVVVVEGIGLNKTFVLSLLKQLSAQQREAGQTRLPSEQASIVLRSHEQMLEQMVRESNSLLQ